MKAKLLFTLSALTWVMSTINAQSPQLLNYQAVVRDAQGQPVQNTLVNFQFHIHDGTMGGNPVFTETDTATTNQFGLATVVIGSSGSLNNISWGHNNKYLEVGIDIGGGGTFTVMGTTQLLSVPYSLYTDSAVYAQHAHYADSTATNYWAKAGANIYSTNVPGSVGIGTNTPGMLLDVISPVDTNSNVAIRGIAAGALNSVIGVMGISASNGNNTAGVYGLAAGNGGNAGVFGETRSPSGVGVYAQSDDVGGWGLQAVCLNTTGSAVGVEANVQSPQGIAVQGIVYGSGGIAIQGLNTTAGADTNIAGYFVAQGGAANYALVVPANSGMVGIGTVIPSVLLDVESGASPAFKLTDGTQQNGYVLTSDSNGNASWQQSSAPAHYIGQSYGGGIVFWVDSTGQHGLIAASTDQSTGLAWFNGANITTNAVSNGGVGAGRFNTYAIIIGQGAGSFAAQTCNSYSGGNYGDWYLPSKYELNLMYLNIGPGATGANQNIGAFVSSVYWSSTEDSNANAWYQSFLTGIEGNIGKNHTYYVRAVRGF